MECVANRYFYISDAEWFDSTVFKNPLCTLDHALQKYFPEFYSLHYDVRLLAAKATAAEEKASPFYNDYRERYGATEISSFDEVIADKRVKSVFLNGFTQQQFLYVASQIKDSAEVIYLFKCPKINDLSILSLFANLRCVHIFWNHSLESLWDMRENKRLKVLSCEGISKLKNIETVKDSCLEYIHLDSSDNNGHRKLALFEPTVFGQMPHLKHLSLAYKDLCVDR